jgi:hypothetical protein
MCAERGKKKIIVAIALPFWRRTTREGLRFFFPSSLSSASCFNVLAQKFKIDVVHRALERHIVDGYRLVLAIEVRRILVLCLYFRDANRHCTLPADENAARNAVSVEIRFARLTVTFR